MNTQVQPLIFLDQPAAQIIQNAKDIKGPFGMHFSENRDYRVIDP